MTGDKRFPERKGAALRILVYSHDTFGLGNFRRMLSICNYLTSNRPDVSVLIVTGSTMPHSFRLGPGIDYVKLPCLKRGVDGEFAVRYLDLTFAKVLNMRRNLIRSSIESFAPDVLLVDKKPNGLEGELGASIETLRDHCPNAKLMLVLRDILDGPEATMAQWRARGYFDLVRWWYDAVLVLGSPAVFDVRTEYGFPADIAAKTKFCGFIKRDPPAIPAREMRRTLGVREGEQLVLVTAGGGEDGEALMAKSIGAIRMLRRERPVRGVVITGPELAESRAVALAESARGDECLRVIRFTDDMMSHLAAADTVVSMAGYNTVCELLTAGRRAVLVPRVVPGIEQKIRAERLAGLGYFRMLSPENLTPAALASAVAGELDGPGIPSFPPTDLGALPRLANIVLGAHKASRPSWPEELQVASGE